MSKPLVLGHIDLSFHAASAALVRQVLLNAGHRVKTTAAPHVDMFERHRQGEVDILVSAWLPASHGAYLQPYVEEVLLLGKLYNPYCIWGVPDYVPEVLVGEVADLLKPEVVSQMTKRIQGIGSGAGISRFSRQIIERYGLKAVGYHFENGTEADCISSFEQAVAEQRWVIIPLWHPQFLHFQYKIRALKEPLRLLGSQDAATVVIRREAADQFEPQLLATLCAMQLGNDAVTELDYRIVVERLTPNSAARHWLSRNQAAVATWATATAS